MQISLSRIAPDASKNALIVPETATVGKAFTITAVGDRQNAQGALTGEERFIPDSWSANGASGGFTLENGAYSASLLFDEAGEYTISVTYRLERYENGAWNAVGNGTEDVKTAKVNVQPADTPQTGDELNVGGWLMLAGMAAVVMVGVLIQRKRMAKR